MVENVSSKCQQQYLYHKKYSKAKSKGGIFSMNYKLHKLCQQIPIPEFKQPIVQTNFMRFVYSYCILLLNAYGKKIQFINFYFMMIPSSLNCYPYYQQILFSYPALTYFYQNTLNYPNGHWNYPNQVQMQQIFTNQHQEFDNRINKEIKIQLIQDPIINNYDQVLKKQQSFDAEIVQKKEKKFKQHNMLKYYDPNIAPLLISTKNKIFPQTYFQATPHSNQSNSCYEKKQKAKQINQLNQQANFNYFDDLSQQSPFIILKKNKQPNIRKKLLIQRRLLRTSLLLKTIHKQSVKKALIPLILKRKIDMQRNDINDGSFNYQAFKNYKPRKINNHFIDDQSMNNKKRKHIRHRYKTLLRSQIPKKRKKINKIYQKSIKDNKIIQDVSKQKQLCK